MTDKIILYVAIGLSSFNVFVLCLYFGCTKKAETVKTDPQCKSQSNQARRRKKPNKRRNAEFKTLTAVMT